MSEEAEKNLSSVLNQFVNETFGKTNQTIKEPATVEGQLIAYSALILMAVFPIFFGSFRAVKFREEQHKTGEKPETISKNDAMKFPLIASAVLFGIYIVFKLFSQEYINMLLSFYFFILGTFSVYHIAGSFLAKLVPSLVPNQDYHLLFTEGKEEEEIVNYNFDRKDIIAFLICIVPAAWYALKKHWIANNVIGLAFATNGVELLHLNSFGTGCILLIGLFFYDVFWVFGTNVMVTVAKNFEAPIKVLFPQDFLVRGIFAKNFSMLGLGDIVIPGIFVALLLRFDLSLKRNQKTYFYSCFIAYFLGLVATIVVMVVFQHPQPALLYLVPACITVPVGVAYLKGDVEKMFAYSDEKSDESTEGKSSAEKKSSKKAD